MGDLIDLATWRTQLDDETVRETRVTARFLTAEDVRHETACDGVFCDCYV